MNSNKEIDEYIENSDWIWAKTYAHFSPHWYVVTKEGDDFLGLIRLRLSSEGIDIEYMKKKWVVWNHGEYRYWIDKAYQEGLFIINRTFIEKEKRDLLVKK